MKLLIVDDEELTRTGVIASIDWKSLGIDEVFQADDGVMVWKQPESINLRLFSVMYVCREWMELPCWSEWRNFSLIPSLFL